MVTSSPIFKQMGVCKAVAGILDNYFQELTQQARFFAVSSGQRMSLWCGRTDTSSVIVFEREIINFYMANLLQNTKSGIHCKTKANIPGQILTDLPGDAFLPRNLPGNNGQYMNRCVSRNFLSNTKKLPMRTCFPSFMMVGRQYQRVLFWLSRTRASPKVGWRTSR